MYGSETINTQDKKEIDFLKKCNKQIIFFKSTAIILALFIVFMWSFILIQNINTSRQGKYVYSIINEVYENIEEFIEQNNFVFSTKQKLNEITYYYKDGKFKEEIVYIPNSTLGCNLKYGKMIDGSIITLNYWDYVKVIDSTVYRNITDKEYIFSTYFEGFNNLLKKDVNELGKFIVTEEIINDIDCYVLNGCISNEEYILVLDKENMLLLKYVYTDSNGTSSWIDYEYKANVVSDDDVKLKDFGNYYIDENAKNYLNEF